MEEIIGNFSSPSEELPFVQASQQIDSNKEKEEVSSNPEIGYFEKHTKGIGMKLMTIMGYQQGKGLDKHGQGRLQLISIQERPQYEGLGFDQSTCDYCGNKGQ